MCCSTFLTQTILDGSSVVTKCVAVENIIFILTWFVKRWFQFIHQVLASFV
ncbi:hypothetical protein Hanom_Chr04g00346281 [Helianthus anomalus]